MAIKEGGLSTEQGFKPAHYDIDRLKGKGLRSVNYWGTKLEGGPDLKRGTSDPSSYHGLLLSHMACKTSNSEVLSEDLLQRYY